MELAETCSGTTDCQRSAIFEFTQGGETIRLDCGLNLPGATPVFVSVTPQWLADETILRSITPMLKGRPARCCSIWWPTAVPALTHKNTPAR